MVAILAIVLLPLMNCEVRAEEKSQNQPNPSVLFSEIAQLPAHKVVLQHAAETPPANGPHSRNGTETVFEWKGMRYTLWIWDMKADPAFPEVKWARLYYRPIGSSGSRDLGGIDDARLDGIIDGGMCADTERDQLNPLLSLFSMDPKFVRVLAEGPNDLKGDGREEQLAKWQQRYNGVLRDLVEFLENTKSSARQAKR